MANGLIEKGLHRGDRVGFLISNREEEPNVDLTYEDGFNIMYTSGTTGVPKGIFHTHHNRLVFALLALDFRRGGRGTKEGKEWRRKPSGIE
ncbi:MAG: AMP-binding protein [Thermodesulfobacteriota bacterium]